jgi:PAS domain S-box-containing protein
MKREKKAEKALRQSEANLYAFMDNNPAVIYIKDAKGRHLYGNKTLLAVFGKSMDEFIGTTSHDIFADHTAERLEAYDETVKTKGDLVKVPEWSHVLDGELRWWKEVKFPLTGRSGEALVGGIALEISDLKRTEKVLDESLRFERTISELSTKFIDLPIDEIDEEIVDGLLLISEFLGFNRSTLFTFSEDKTQLRSTHTWTAEGIPPSPLFLISNQFPWGVDKLLRGEMIQVARPDDLPIQAVQEKEYLQREGLKSLVAVPLRGGRLILGVVGYGVVGTERTWPDGLIQRLQLTGDIFANAMARKLNEEKLRHAFAEIRALKEKLEQENIYLRKEIEVHSRHAEMVGDSKAMKFVLSQAEKVAKEKTSVLILGETGTGKELLARAIHNLSPRRLRPMMVVNCAALPTTLIESELFGREKGAFTGAISKQVGRFEAADGSTIFLDEIGDLPLELQAKLLRVLQEGQFERLGSHETTSVDVRIIAATNTDLAEAVQQGRFRRDLYYRLNVFPITVPPLRERQEDIPILVWVFVREYERGMGKRIETIEKKTMDLLSKYSWPGNVRELRNVIERAMILSEGSTLRIDRIKTDQPLENTSNLTLEEIERRHILQVLQSTGWRVSGSMGAAEILDLKPTTLEARMRKLGVRRPS